MSRLGKQPISIPEKTEVSVSDGVLTVKGPLGELSRAIHPKVSITTDNNEVTVSPVDNSISSRALWGTYASHLQNMIQGVQKPYEKKLVVEGVGYRAEVSGNKITMQLGFSHPVEMQAPEDITLSAEKNIITISSINKESVGQFAAEIRAHRPPEPYKGKGIRYEDETVRRKQGKKAAG